MTTERFERVLNKNVYRIGNVFKSDILMSIDIIEDLLIEEIEHIKETEPYAVNSIRNLEIARQEISNLYNTIDDLEEE